MLLVVEAVWDSFADSDDTTKVTDAISSEPVQLFMAISKAALGTSSDAHVVHF